MKQLNEFKDVASMDKAAMEEVQQKAKEYEINKNGIFMPEWFFDSYEMPGRRMNRSRGIEIYPEGIYDIALMIKEKYNNINKEQYEDVLDFYKDFSLGIILNYIEFKKLNTENQFIKNII